MRRCLNIGCGARPTPSSSTEQWTNLDRVRHEGVDVSFDLETCHLRALPFPDNHFDHVHGSHILEHIDGILPLMEELWRVTRPDGTAEFRVPYGGSDEAWEDPTHRRAFFHGSWKYFSQLAYWGPFDYGFRGDWDVVRVRLRIPSERVPGLAPVEVFDAVRHGRNFVQEMVAELRCVKPARRFVSCPEFGTNVVLEFLESDSTLVQAAP